MLYLMRKRCRIISIIDLCDYTDLVFDKIEKQIDNILEVDSENDVKKETTNTKCIETTTPK